MPSKSDLIFAHLIIYISHKILNSTYFSCSYKYHFDLSRSLKLEFTENIFNL